MDRQTAIGILRDNIQEIAKDPQGKLLKIADEKRLSPAQLEYLAQVYNGGEVLRALEWSKTAGVDAAQAAASANTIDATELSKNYHRIRVTPETASRTMAKAAATPVRVMSPSELADTLHRTAFRGELTALEREDLEKAAKARERWDRLHEQESLVKYAMQCRDAIEETRSKLRAIGIELSEGAGALEKRGSDVVATRFADFEADLRDHGGEDVIDIVKAGALGQRDWLVFPEPRDTSKQVLARDLTGYAVKAAKLAADLRALNEADRILKVAAGAGTKDKKDTDTKTDRKKTSPGSDYTHAALPEVPTSATVVRTESKDGDTDLSGVETAIKGMLQLPQRYGEQLSEGQPPVPKAMLGDPNPKLKLQRKADDTAREMHQQMALARLIVTDPVLADQDPNDLAALFGSIQNANPDIAADPEALRAALREAVAYQGIGTDTYARLVDTRKKRTETERNEIGNNLVKYRGN